MHAPTHPSGHTLTPPVTRFAPSPTGWLHLGHAFAALTAFSAAGPGGLVLRIEDLDRGRCRPEFDSAIREDLAWLGLSWREPVLRQSGRSEAYRDALATLGQRGLLYPCFCTRTQVAAEIARAAEAPHAGRGPGDVAAGVYPGTCRALSAAERQRRMQSGEPFALRLHAAGAAAQLDRSQLFFCESGSDCAVPRGRIPVDPLLLGDVVLARKDLPAAYHLAVVVDDAFQGITRVTRAEDLFASTHVQRLLQALLGLPAPLYAHHRLILDAQGRKLSKRDQAQALRSLRAEGTTAAEVRRRLGFT
jgi:glutamyl-Q tRNA(Asp) synthetase